jgi:hypothetical protein
MTPIESAGNNAAWPRNLPGKPTQLAVFGVERTAGGLRYELTFTGRFPDLDKAMYWGAKREVQTLRDERFMIASRVLWQHDLTPEAAVAETFAQMEPQLRRALAAADVGFDAEAALFNGDGPMRPVDPKEVKGYYVEVQAPRDDVDEQA